jgi:rhodanese-related sulfurtransferase
LDAIGYKKPFWHYLLFPASSVGNLVQTAREAFVVISLDFPEGPVEKFKTNLSCCFCSLMVFVLLAASSPSAAQQKQEGSSASKASSLQASDRAPDFLPLEITPEGVLALQKEGAVQLELINADKPPREAQAVPSELRHVYYTTDISIRAARNAVLRDRQQQGNRATPSTQPSQRLTGTPLDWRRLALPVDREAFAEKRRSLTPRALSEAIKDGVDLQIIDLRPRPPPPPESSSTPESFPKALNLFPHQLTEAVPELSKSRWLVLIDDGDGIAVQLAEQLFNQGFLLVGFLEGGYPAWVAATDR